LLKIAIHQELSEILRVGILRLSNLQPDAEAWESLWRDITQECEKIGAQFKGRNVGEVPGVSETRRLYRAVGLDPTKTRPSSEALLRRAMKGLEWYRIHPVVDLFNYVSLKTLLPLGLYDESKIVGDTVTIRLGKEGWSFPGIRKDDVNVAHRLCVEDADGPFGSPTSDSLRTAIEGDVSQALVIVFQHVENDIQSLQNALNLATNLATTHLGARVNEKFVLPLRS
jgi:DNA/RNA-binding domain of Phe-tRNA-synthetase-like protein